MLVIVGNFGVGAIFVEPVGWLGMALKCPLATVERFVTDGALGV
jgi:hypothetical protein